MNRLFQYQVTTLRLVIAGLLACLAISPPIARAVVPPPDGGYSNFNTAEGTKALFSLTTGSANTAVGWFSLFSDTDGSFNTATGAASLLFNTANRNTATGAGALLSNTTAADNTANGAFALLNNTTGEKNTAIGAGALFSSTTGMDNTAVGTDALHASVVGGNNTGIGVSALSNNIQSQNNTAVGKEALLSHTGGNGNTAIGLGALFSNTTGGGNTAVGIGALANHTVGSNNIALGTQAGLNITSGDNNIFIGHAGVDGQNNTINIGTAGTHSAVFINGIFGASTISGIPVYIDAFSQLGTVSSSRRFKEEIKPMDTASEAILALKPVMFQYKGDKSDAPQFGLIAEDVAAVDPDLIVRDNDGEIYTVRYDAVNAMLLNEFLKEHSTVQELKKEVAALTATVKQQAEQLEKVSASIQMGKLGLNVARNNQ
jgi:hypothetical protein